MSFNLNKIKNITFSLKYFNIIKSLNDNYLNYIKSYYSASKDFFSILLNIQKKNNEKTKETLNKLGKTENVNLSQIIKFISVIPKILDIHLQNLDYLLKNLENEMKSYQNFLKEKEILVLNFESQFEDVKKNFITKDNEINKLKISFLNNMKNSEETIYKFYSLQKEKKDPNKKNKDKKNVINLNKHSITEEQVNNCINNTKKIENDYKEILETGKLFQDTYIQSENTSSENIKRIISDISIQLKQSIMNVLMSLKNNFKIPEKEIDNYLAELISEKGKQKIEEAMTIYFDSNPIEKKLYNPIKYNIQVLKINNGDENKKKNNNKNSDKNILIKFLGNKNKSSLPKGENKISIFEDGLDQMTFINDEIALSTTKKMINSFSLINSGGYNLNIENEKITTDKLSKKLIINFQKPKFEKKKENIIKEEKNFNNIENNNGIGNNNNIENNNNDECIIDINNEVINITEQEIKLFEQLLDKHHNRIIFLQNLNVFRSTGKLVIPKKLYEILGYSFNIILNTTKRDNDIYSTKNVILLSLTYYTIENGKKIYLQNLILDNELFKDNKFWEDFLELEINRDIKRLTNIEEIKYYDENISEGVTEKDPKKIENIFFCQILTVCDNMVSFGIDKETIFNLIDSKIKTFNLNQDTENNIKTIIESRINEKYIEEKK